MRDDRSFRVDIEGLRGIAVLAVVLFHAGLPGIGGGFVGVDVFFVISGFLITGLLWRELDSYGTIRLARFYAARARRLLPAACVVLVATAYGAILLLPPLRLRDVLLDGAASALYVGNYRFAIQGTDYLAADAPPSPFQHYWSLCVEEQFYLLWPAILIAVAWLIRRAARPRTGQHGRTSHRARRTDVRSRCLYTLAAIGLLSFLADLATTTNLPPWAFFSLPTRAWELAIGGAVALTAWRWRELAPAALRALGWAGLALIALACLVLDESTPYPGTAALLPTVGTALVIVSGCGRTMSDAGRILATPALRTTGRLSYSLYLWHWPVLLLAPAALERDLGLSERIIAVAVAVGLAALTMQFVEKPVRYAAALRASPAAGLAVGGVATAIALSTTLVLAVAGPTPVGHGAAAPSVTIAAPAPTQPAAGAAAAPAPNTLVEQLTAQVQAAVAASAGARPVPSNLSPALADAAGDKPAVFTNGCVRSWLDLGQPECGTGVTRSTTTVALVGDSHAAMWQPALELIADRRQWRLETMAKVTCPLMDLPITSPYLGRTYTECERWRADVLARLRAERPKLVVLGMSRRYGGDFGFVSYDRAWQDTLGRLVAELRAAGSAVLVLGPVPDPHSIVPTCLSAHPDNASACAPTRPVAVNDAGIANETTAVSSAGGRYADLTQLFCTAEQCPVIVGNNLVYRDDNHLTVEYARTLTSVIEALADRALAPA
nr:acyltransferase family protein [Skermania piniformis]